MAFEYKSTATMASAAIPTLNVQANMAASKAFQTLSGMVSDVAKVKAATMEAEAKSIQKQNKGEVTLRIGAARQMYTQASAEAGLDSLAQQQLAEMYMKETDTLYNTLDADSQAQLASFYNDNRNAVVNSYTTTIKKARKNDFEQNFSSTLPAILSQDDNLRAATLAAYASDSRRFGVEPNDFGKLMVNQTINFRINNIPDERAMINNRDYTYVNQMERDLAFMEQLDPNLKGKDYFSEANKKVKTIRNAINTQLVGELKQTIDTGDVDAFQGLLIEGVTHQAISKNEGVQYEKEFLDKKLNNTQAQAQTIFDRNGGKPVLSNIADSKVRNATGTLIDAQITNMFASGQIDYNTAEHHATRNSEKYVPIYKNARNSLIGQVRQIAGEPAKTPQEEASKASRVLAALNDVRKMDRYAFGSLSSDDLLKADVMEMLVAGNAGNNIPAVLKVLDNQGGVGLINKNNSYVEDIYEDLPKDSQAKAHRQFSALVAAGIGEDEAYSLVEDLHTYTAIGDQSFEFSNGAVENLTKAGLTQGSLEYFENELLDRLPPEMMFSVQEVLDGTNAKMTYLNGTLYFKNDEMDDATVILYPDQMKSLVDSANTQWQDDNVAKGLEIVADTVATDLSRNANSLWQMIKSEAVMYDEYLQAETAPAVNELKGLVKGLGDQPRIINNMIDTWVKKDASTAWKEYLKESRNNKEIIDGLIDKSNKKEREEFKKARSDWEQKTQEFVDEMSNNMEAPAPITKTGEEWVKKQREIADYMTNNDFSTFVRDWFSNKMQYMNMDAGAATQPLSIANNNPGNIKGNDWAGDTGERYGKDKDFAVFDSPEMGARALIKDIRAKINKTDGDIAAMMSEYAPKSDNNPTAKYIETIKKAVGKDYVTFEDTRSIVEAIIKFENTPDIANQYLSDPNILDTAMKLAERNFKKGTTLEQAKKQMGIK
jgi:hypothetical protein